METCLAPSLGMGDEDIFTLSYGHYNYNTDVSEIWLTVVTSNYGLPYFPYSFPSEDLGITSTSPLDPYPNVVCRNVIDGNAIEAFIAHKSFRDGADDDPTPFPEKFGYTDIKSIVIRGSN